jgi:hypothetical protein
MEMNMHYRTKKSFRTDIITALIIKDESIKNDESESSVIRRLIHEGAKALKMPRSSYGQ